MATIVTRSGKGSPLTHAEVDANFTNLNTDKLELSGGTMTGNLSFGDNNKAIFGAGSDLQIYHDGSNSYIDDQGTGRVYIRASDQLRLQASDGENYALFAANGAAQFYYDNSQKLATTSTGVDVTGTVLVGNNDSVFAENNLAFKSGGSAYIDHYTPDADIIFRTSNSSALDTTALVIDASTGGNVGIGTSSIGQKLTVDGNIQLGTSSGAGKLYLASSSGFSPRLQEASNALAIYTNNSERCRIDASGNLLHGKTVQSIGTVGVTLVNGQITATADGSDAIRLNRKSSDGSIIDLRKDGTTVGSIQARSSFTTLQIGSTGTGITGTSSHAILPSVNNVRSDNTNDLGISNYRWKDLFLSGGVYLGGVGSANKLEDYEEGTWTVALTPSTSGTIGLSSDGGAFYTKIGQVVHFSISVTNNSISSPVGIISFNLPFAAASGFQKGRSALALYFDGAAGSNVADFIGLTIDGTSEGRIYLGDNPASQSDSAQQMDGSTYILISGSYITSA